MTARKRPGPATGDARCTTWRHTCVLPDVCAWALCEQRNALGDSSNCPSTPPPWCHSGTRVLNRRRTKGGSENAQ
eukprot:1468326-Pyramimonas_sp.AAC.1